MALTPERLAAAKQAAACCALTEGDAAVEAQIHGDAKCAQKHRMRAAWLLSVSYRLCDPCLTDSEKEDLIRLLDCECNYGGCRHDEVPDCALVADYTVLDAVDQADLPLSPATDDAYFILSGTNAGQIATWDGSEWQYEQVGVFELVWATVTNDYWSVGTGGGTNTGAWFPAPQMLNVIPDWWLASIQTPWMAQGRDLQLQLLGPNGWYNAAVQTNEDDLSQYVNLTGLPIVSNEGVRWQYTVDGCTYNSAAGFFDPPIEPPAPCDIIPAFTVLDTVDANQEATLLPSGAYLIISNEFGVSNTWSQHVGEVVNEDGTFTSVAVGTTVYDSGTSTYWFLYGAGWAPLFPPLTITPGIGSITVTSDYPTESAENDRYILVLGTVNSVEVVLASGTESQLPFVVGSFGTITNPYATYVLAGPCTYNAPVTLNDDTPITEDFDCSAIQYFTYRYTDAPYQQQSWLFTVPPGETITFFGIEGEMEAGTVIRSYDGTDDTGIPIPTLTGSFASLNGVNGVTTTNSLYMEVDSPTNMPADMETWLFQVSCAPVEALPTADVSVEDKCDESQIAITIDLTFMGSLTDLALEYNVNGGAWQVADPSITAIGIYAVGSFFYNDEIGVRLVPVTPYDPLAIVLLGYFTNGGTCPDPCAPDGAIKIDEAGDLSDLPTPAPLDGWLFLVASDTTNIGTWQIGEVIQWDLGTNQWIFFSSNPGVWNTSSPAQYWVTTGPGIQPYPLLPIVHMSPTGNTPNNWSAISPDVVFYQVPINSPVAIEVRNGFGSWTQVWTGTVQQLANVTAFPIALPFTNARAVFNYDTCGLVGGVVITA